MLALALPLAIAALDITGQAALKPLSLFIGGLLLIAAAAICSPAGLLALNGLQELQAGARRKFVTFPVLAVQ